MPHHHRQIQQDTTQIGTLPDADRLSATEHWQRLLDAGLIGTHPPAPPAHLANIRHTERIFRSGALYRQHSGFAR